MALITTNWNELSSFNGGQAGDPGTVYWTNPSYTQTDDTNYADANQVGTADYTTKLLRCSISNINIKIGSNIKGVESRINRYFYSGDCSSIKVIDSDVTINYAGNSSGNLASSACWKVGSPPAYSNNYGNQNLYSGIPLLSERSGSLEIRISALAVKSGFNVDQRIYIDNVHYKIHYNPTGLFMAM